MSCLSIFIAVVAVFAGLYWLSMRGRAAPQEDPEDSDFLEARATHPFHDFEPDLDSGTAKALRAAISEEKT